MSFRLGPTGSIGMGKSTTAAMFASRGCAVWDADAAVHRLYAAGGAAVGPLATHFPTAIVADAVSRPVLRDIISKDPDALQRIESIVHPLVQADRNAFGRRTSARIAVFDIPLLFETGAETEMQATVCVRVSRETQKARVLARGTMTAAEFTAMLAKQLPIEDKLARSDYHVDTSTLETANRDVQAVLDDIDRRI